MKQKVSKFLVEITMVDIALPEFLDDVLDPGGDTMVHEFKILKETTVIADVEGPSHCFVGK